MAERGNVRASDADRERTVDRLHKAATEGRIASDELEQRVSHALKARTYSELEATVVDLPGQRRREAKPAHPARRPTATGWALSAVRANPLLLIFLIPVVAVTAAMLLAASIVWMVLMTVVMIVGRGHGMPRPPLPYAVRREFHSARRRNHWA